MGGYDQVISEHLRITILRLLNDHNGTSNDSLLCDLVAPFGFNPSRDKMRTELNWLEEQGLVECSDNGCMTVILTQRGEDVAECRITVPGVKRPTRR